MSNILETLENKYCKQEPFVSAKIVAKHLSINLFTVYKLAQRGKIKSHKFGKSRRFRLSEIEE